MHLTANCVSHFLLVHCKHRGFGGAHLPLCPLTPCNLTMRRKETVTVQLTNAVCCTRNISKTSSKQRRHKHKPLVTFLSCKVCLCLCSSQLCHHLYSLILSLPGNLPLFTHIILISHSFYVAEGLACQFTSSHVFYSTLYTHLGIALKMFYVMRI